jgi:hypothetical protein
MADAFDSQINSGFAALAPVEEGHMAAARGQLDGLSEEIQGLFGDFERNASAAHEASATLHPQLQKLRDSLATRLNQVQVMQEAQALEVRVPAEVKGRLDAATTAVQMMEPLLFAHALPTLKDPQERAAAVHEVEMLTAGLSGVELVLRLTQLAKGSDRRHSAVVASSWGKARLGGDEAAHNIVVREAVKGSLAYGTESEKKHAAAYGALPATAMKALAVARTRTRERLRGRPI